MSQPQSSSSRRKLSLALLITCILAVLVGVFYQERELAMMADRPAVDESTEVASGDGAHTPWDKAAKFLKGKALAHIVLDGPIEMKLEEGVLGDKASNAVKVRKALDAVAHDKRIQGVLLSVNSPGGTVGMSQELHAAVERVRETKPVVAHFGDIAASGGYYTAVAADRIIANPGTLTASIGVIISGFNLSDLMNNKLGIEANTIKSGKHKDMLSPYRDPSASDLALLQGIVDTSYKQFIGVVLEGRTKQVADDKAAVAKREAVIREVADGRVVTGAQALESYLVDGLGDVYAAHRVLDNLVRQRNEVPERGDDEKPLPLESYSVNENILSAFKIPFTPGMSVQQLLSAVIPGQTVVTPLSAKYPKQPLWILE
jgi:protease-4